MNTNPCLEESSNLLKCYIPWMLDDMFKLTIDVRYWKKEHDDAEPQKPLSIKGYQNSENLWEMIHDFNFDQ